ASPTITSSGSHPRNTRSPSRTMRWSSTIKTRIVMSASPRLQVRLYRKLHDEHRMGHREQEHTSCLTFRIRSKSVCCEQTYDTSTAGVDSARKAFLTPGSMT